MDNVRTSQTHPLKIDELPIPGVSGIIGMTLCPGKCGDSDSTGAIAGNILGALLGIEDVPAAWFEQLELREVIEAVGSDLLTGFADSREWGERYPGH